MVTATVKEDGFEGILFPGNGSKDKVLIVMSGSNGEENIMMCELQAERGDGA